MLIRLVKRKGVVGLILLFIVVCIIPNINGSNWELNDLMSINHRANEQIRFVNYPLVFSVLNDNNEFTECYGFIINVSAYQHYDMQTTICRLINDLFNKNITIYWICENISVLSTDIDEEREIINRSFETGIFIIPFINNTNHNVIATTIVKEYNISENVEIYQLNEPINNIKIYILYEPKIAHYNRYSIDSESYSKCLSEAGFHNQELLSPKDVINNLTIDKYNIFIIGGQDNTFQDEISDILKLISFFANKKIKDFVNSGGGFIGSCGGGAIASSGYYRPWFLPVSFSHFLYNFIPFQIKIIDRAIYRALPGGGGLYFNDAGSGVIIRIVNHSCPVSFGLPDIINKTNYWGGPMFLKKIIVGSPNSDNLAVIDGLDENGWNWNYSMKEHILWWCLLPDNYKNRLIERWVDYSMGKALWVTAKYGDGKVVAFGDHPEYCAWCNTSPRIIYNTVFYTSSKGPLLVDINYAWP